MQDRLTRYDDQRVVKTAARYLPAIVVVASATIVLALSVRPVGVEAVWAIAGGRLVALALLAAGIALWFAGRPVGAVAAALAGLSWAGVIWAIERATDADALVGAGMIVSSLLVPMLILLVMDLPGLWRFARLTPVLAVGSVVIALCGVTRVLVYEPIRDLHCGLFCGHSPVLLAGNPGLAAWLGAVAGAATAIVCGTMAAGLFFPRSSRTVGRLDLLPRILSAFAFGALSAAAVAGIVQGSIGATADDLARVVAVRAAACLAVSVAAVIVAAERLSIGRNLARIARLLATESDRSTAEALLRDAVGDPSLVVGYWIEERGYVGADGRPVDTAAPGQQRTELTSRGRPIAIVIHDSHALPVDLVDARIGPEARLAIQNESLELELARRLDQLRAARRRVVDVGDAERRQLERDLHDGAQQLLLALSFEIRRGERSAYAQGDEVSAALFAELRGVTGRILEQLRALAQGIHPTILTNAGLGPALMTYAGTLASPPMLTVDVPHRLPAPTEASVYALVTDLVASAPDGAAVSCTIREEDDTVHVRVDRVINVPDHVLDRLNAAGGRYVAGESGQEFVLPCG